MKTNPAQSEKLGTKLSRYTLFLFLGFNAFLYINGTSSANELEGNAAGDERPVYQEDKNPQSILRSWLSSEPRSLALQRLEASTYPKEAELYCSTTQCTLGLSRDLVVGGDVFGMAYAPLRSFFDPNWVSGGGFYLIDVFGGFQILRGVEGKKFMNAQLGYRRLNFSDGMNEIATQGITTKVSFSQIITPIYTQNLEFSAYFTMGNAQLNNGNALRFNSPDYSRLNSAAGYFYRVSQKYPTFFVSLPADLEIANWSSEKTGLNTPIRQYLRVEPMYIQNSLSFTESNRSVQKREQNFGIRLGTLVSYESTFQDVEPGRFTLKGGLGMDILTSDMTTITTGDSDLSVPRRPSVSPYLELAGSWQF